MFFVLAGSGGFANDQSPAFLKRARKLGFFACASRSARMRSLGDLDAYFRAVEISVLALHACTAYNYCMQYTIRGIPVAVDNALRERARADGKSLNEAAVDALAEGSGMTGSRRKRRDLADIARTWKADKAVEAALADQDRVDEDLWR